MKSNKSKKIICLVLLCSILILKNVDNFAQSRYELDGVKDSAILLSGTSLLMWGYSHLKKLEPFTDSEINRLSLQDVNKFDRWTCTQWSPTISTMSDYLLTFSMLLPATLMFSEDIRKDAGAISLLYLENFILTTAGITISKGLAKRTRPFVYNPNVSKSIKMNDSFTRRSFYSGHTASSFSATIFWATVISEYHPDTKWRPYLWSGAIGLATVVGIFRVLSGVHYPSDVLTGAFMGCLTGYLIPKIHEKKQGNKFNSAGNDVFYFSINIPL